MEDPIWTVVRCKSQKTLEIVEELTKSNLRAWTPSCYTKRRLPRTRKTVVMQVAHLPSFVFVQLKDIEDKGGFDALERFLVQPMKAYDGTVFRIRDDELMPLRMATTGRPMEEGGKPIKPPLGSKWTLLDGPFTGLTGKVVHLGPGHAVLEFEARQSLRFKIGYFQLSRSAILAKPGAF